MCGSLNRRPDISYLRLGHQYIPQKMHRSQRALEHFADPLLGKGRVPKGYPVQYRSLLVVSC